MTDQTTKPTQKRLHGCVLAPPKRTKIRKKLRQHSHAPPKISDFGADTIVRVANAPENPQARCNSKLLGKYPFIV